MGRMFGFVSTAVAIGCAFFAASAVAKKLEVCDHGCKYRTVQSAVNAVKKGEGTTVKVKGGTYKEGVRVVGHKYDGLKIVGNPNAPNSVVMNGKNAKVHVPGQGTQLAQNAIEGL